MKNIGLILAVIITVGFVYVFGANNSIISVNFINHNFNIGLFIYALCAFLLGLFSGALLMLRGFFESSDNYRKLKRQYEKTSIGADDSGLRVKTLENKIKTLEEALKKALEK